jgi:hypothetical protein
MPGTSGASVGRRLLPFREKGRFIFLLVWALSAGYVFSFRNRGWIPSDEGMLGQSAERVLNGQVPHRDFPETYTGGLTYWNALAFRVFGLRLTSLRLILFLSFLAFVPAVFAIATRFGSPLASGLVTLLAVAWSLPNYFAAIPSWYNLFLAAWGVLALLRHVETGQRRWLFLAGALAGISCLFKVIGAHLIAAALLFLVYRERDLSEASGQAPGGFGGPQGPPRRLLGHAPGQRHISGFLLFVTTGLALFLTVLFLIVRSHLDEMEFVHFLAPAAMVCGFLIWREASGDGGSFARRFSVLMRLVLALAAGVLLPILLFLIPFALKGALGDVWRGLVAGTGGHVLFVRMYLPTLSAFLPALPYTIILGAGSLRRFRFAGPVLALLGVALAGALWLSGTSPDVYRTVWYSVRSLGVSAVFAACLRLAHAHRLGFWSPETRQKVFLLAAVVAVTGLVQFPFAAPIYFFYFAPLVALLIFALVGSEPRPPRLVHAAMLAFYLLFALLRTNPGYVYGLGHRFERYDSPAVLDIPRAGGLRVTAKDAELYGSLIPLIQEKSGGKPIYTGPNCPEIHFLSGLDEVVSDSAGAHRDPMQRPGELFRNLEENGTRAVVLNQQGPWARKIRPEVFTQFEKLFPHSRAIGQFVARWKENEP